MRLVELVAVVLVGGLVAWAVLRVSTRSSAPPRDRWTTDVRTLPDGTVVVRIVRPGQHPREVQQLAPGLGEPEFSEALMAAQSRAEEQAAALNHLG